MKQNTFVHFISKILVDIMFFSGIIVCLSVPWWVRLLAPYFHYEQNQITQLSVILVSSGFCALYILWQLKTIFKTLLGGDPFIYKNVSCLRKISSACLLIAAVYAAKLFIWFTIATMVIVMVFALATLFCLTLKDVFKRAVEFKEENDLTV